VERVSCIVKDNGLNCIINNAGVINTEHTCIENVNADSLLQTFKINTVAPAMMVKVCWV